MFAFSKRPEGVKKYERKSEVTQPECFLGKQKKVENQRHRLPDAKRLRGHDERLYLRHHSNVSDAA